jgi:hypothetical protein
MRKNKHADDPMVTFHCDLCVGNGGVTMTYWSRNPVAEPCDLCGKMTVRYNENGKNNVAVPKVQEVISIKGGIEKNQPSTLPLL